MVSFYSLLLISTQGTDYRQLWNHELDYSPCLDREIQTYNLMLIHLMLHRFFGSLLISSKFRSVLLLMPYWLGLAHFSRGLALNEIIVFRKSTRKAFDDPIESPQLRTATLQSRKLKGNCVSVSPRWWFMPEHLAWDCKFSRRFSTAWMVDYRPIHVWDSAIQARSHRWTFAITEDHCNEFRN